jgi:hypothetical protein
VWSRKFVGKEHKLYAFSLPNIYLHDLKRFDSSLSNAEVVETLISLLFAGYETSSSTLTNILYQLQKHPEVSSGHGGGEEDEGAFWASAHDLSLIFHSTHLIPHILFHRDVLKYLTIPPDASEGQGGAGRTHCASWPRYYPPRPWRDELYRGCDHGEHEIDSNHLRKYGASFMMSLYKAIMREWICFICFFCLQRVATEDFEFEGYLIPKGQVISYNLHTMIQEDPRWVDEIDSPLDPNLFNPSRHIGSSTKQLDSKQGSLNFFGLGSRTCPGNILAIAEMKVMLATIARSFDFRADPGVGEKMIMIPIPVVANGLPIVITKIWVL